MYYFSPSTLISRRSNKEKTILNFWLLPYQNSSYQPIEKLIRQLSESELKKFNSCSAKRKKEFLLGRQLLRLAIQQQLSIPIQSLQVIERDGLPPRIPLAEENGICFNISHSKNLIGVVINQARTQRNNHHLGLDIEHIKSVKNFSTADYFCTTSQLHTLDKAENIKDKTALYYQYWTQKESYLKAMQKGISDTAFKNTEFRRTSETKDSNLSMSIFENDLTAKKEHYQIAIYRSAPHPIHTKIVTLNGSDFNKKIQEPSLNWEIFQRLQ